MLRTFTFALLFVAASLTAKANQPDERIPARVFAPRDGLPAEHITAIAQTTDGVLWVGTSAGLTYFDGHRFQNVAAHGAAASLRVTGLYVTGENGLWVTTLEDGVWRLTHDMRLRKLDALKHERIHTILQRDSATFFFGLTSAWKLDDLAETPQWINYEYEISAPAVARSRAASTGAGPASAALARDGHIVILDRVLGPGVLAEDGSVVFGHENHGDWQSISVDAEGRLWALEYDVGLFGLDDDLNPELVFRSSGNQHLFISRDVAHIATRGGIIRFDLTSGRQLEPFDPTVGLPASAARVSFVDHESSLWIGTRTNLIQIPRPTIRHIEHVDGERLLNVAISAPPSGDELWATSYGSGLVRLAPSLRLESPAEFRRWNSVSSSGSGELLAVGAIGVARYEGGHWSLVRSIPDAVRGTDARSGSVYLWLDGGAYLLSLADDQPVALRDWPVDDRSYHAMGPAPYGDAVIRARELLLKVRVDPETSTVNIDTLGRLGGFENSGGRYLTMDATGAVWIGFWDRGLVRLEAGVATLLLPDENVQHLTMSGDSLVLASTTSGLHAFDVRTQKPVFSLRQEDGLISDITSGATILDDRLYVAHATGVSVVPLEMIARPLPSPPRVHLTSAGVRWDGDDSVPQLGREASFRFFATSYLNPRAISFEHRLGGGDWLPVEGNTLQFHGLRGGTYSLEVRARYKDGEPGPATGYRFWVPTPFYQTRWFRLMLGGMILLLGALVYAARTRVLRRRAAELTLLVAERTERLADAMRTTEKQADLLRRQDELKTRFFANVSHEFRTPLTLIGGIVRDVREGRHGPIVEGIEERLGIVSENANRIERLVEELLDLSRLEAGKLILQPRPGDVVSRLDAIIQAYQPAAERAGVNLAGDFRASSYLANFDARALEKIVGNLISNAIKHSAHDGSIVVHFSTADDGASITIAVTDEGEGIPEPLLPHIFDRFVLGEEEPGSSGIGLALVKELVSLHDGTIGVESRPGCGSCFTVMLPIRREVHIGDGGLVPPALPTPTPWVRSGEPPDQAAAAGPPDAETVLLVDDNADIRAYIAAHLTTRYRVVEAADGDEGLALARRITPDAIISDVMMPGMCGEEMCRRLRADERLSGIPVILLTARAGGEAAVRGLQSGADAYVEKPFHVNALMARVERLISTRRTLKDSYSQVMTIEGLGVEIDSADEVFVKQILELLEQRMEDPTFTVEEMARELAVSSRHLRRRVREATDETPAALLRRYRLEFAARLLAAGATGVSEAGHRVGYASPTAFATQFKKHFGVTPSEYAGAPPSAD